MRDRFLVLEMKSYVLLLALLQAVRCSGVPLYNSELGAMADRGLTAALARVNSVYAVSYLYRATRGSVKKVIPMGLNTVDLKMVFGIKETQCVKASRHDPQTCAFRPGFFVMVSRGRHKSNFPFANQVTTPPPVLPACSLQKQTGDAQPRGDTFASNLV